MQSLRSKQAVIDRRPDPHRVFCLTCEHSEFAHCDQEARRCLYARCGCGGFQVGVAASVTGEEGAHPPAGEERTFTWSGG